MHPKQQRIRCAPGWRRTCSILLVCLIGVMASLGLKASPGRAQPERARLNSAYDLIAAVNQLRASNGLPAYQVNAALMAAAQAHSNYQASIGSVTHSGSGGTRPKDRAAAAGYGGSATIYVSENIAGGMSMTYQSAFQMWQGDSLHLNTMLGANYQDVGAGVATAGGMTFFTLDVGYVAGSAGSGSSGSSASTASTNPVAPATAVAFFPVKVAKPGSDGSIVHEVQPGQSLWSIAATYKVELSDLLALNGFTSNTFIFPGDKILIKPADVTPGAAAQTPPLETTRAARKPTRTPAPLLDATAPDKAGIVTPTPTLEARPISDISPGVNPLIWVIAALVFGGTALIILGNLLKRGG
ncbi:MAG: LysM peptidoglycan-binding domain-containing protein [Anaerolineales bacterium]|nr:LysM peptidoglycan-binding domain-containing protein [Anaerolineales bacterium]